MTVRAGSRQGLATARQACSHPVVFAKSRDPGGLILKRSVRAAVVMPSAFAIARALTGDIQVPLFASFGSFALLLLVDLGGRRASRMRGYAALAATGALLIVIGTLASQSAALAVAAMAVVGFAVLFAGVLAPRAAQAGMYLLISFVLPVSVPVPPAEIAARLGGWGIAAALGLPALALIWPRRWHDRRRAALASAAGCLAAVASSLSGGQAGAEETGAAGRGLRVLRQEFEAAPYPATGTGSTEIALARMLGTMEWAGSLLLAPAGAAPALPPPASSIYAEAARVLWSVSGLLGPATRPAASGLATEVARLHRVRETSLSSLVDRLAEEEERLPGAPPAVSLLGAIFRARAAGLATEELGAEALAAAAVQPHWHRPGHGGAVPPARARWVTAKVIRQRAAAHLTFRSVWLRNSVRGAAGLAAAVALARVAGVSHAFWVALGAMSVLRSNAVGTGASALRAVAGTAVGFVLGSAIMIAAGPHTTALWFLLPVAVLVAGIAPAMISFTAGQAGFTIMVVILFNILVPTGWTVGLVRIEDVGLGCAVSVGAGLLLWPRGAAAELGRALGAAYLASGTYLLAALRRLMSPDPAATAARVGTTEQGQRALASYQRLADAYREFLSERGGKPVSLRTVTGLLTGADRLRLEARSLATLPVRPLGHPPPGAGSALALVEQTAARLEAACVQADARFAAFAEALAGGGPANAARPPGAPEPTGAPELDGLERQLLTAFDAASGSGDPDLIRSTLRLAWAFEYIKDERALQGELAEAARAMTEATR